VSDARATATLATLARIPYLNAAPFYVRWAEAPGATVDLPPRTLGEEARAGRVDAGLMAAADWFALDRFRARRPLGITCRGAVSSVYLLARRPFAELFAPGAGPVTVDLTTESQTSVALTRILLTGRFGARDVRYARRAVEAGAAPAGDAWLLIGDAALRARRSVERDGLHLLDLGATWEEWTACVRLGLDRPRSTGRGRPAARSSSAHCRGGAHRRDRRAALADPTLGAASLARYWGDRRLGPGGSRAGPSALWKEHRLDA
jgi:hypothetical protein